jgi:hypothetical protein
MAVRNRAVLYEEVALDPADAESGERASRRMPVDDRDGSSGGEQRVRDGGADETGPADEDERAAGTSTVRRSRAYRSPT